MERNMTQAPLKDKNDIKIFILYLMRQINYPLEFSDINDIMLQDEFVGYFDFAECFAELLDTGNICEVKGEMGENLYRITEQGCHVADTLQSNLLNMLKNKSLKSAMRLLSFKKSGAKLVCRSEEMPDGRYRLTCGIEDAGAVTMQIQLAVEDKSTVEKMKYTFDDRPEVIYRGVMALLTGEVNYLVD